MNLKKGVWAIHWVIAATLGIMGFMLKNPKAVAPTLRAILSNLPSLPRILKNKTAIDESRAEIAAELSKTRRLFEENEALKQSSDLAQLQQNSSTYGIKKWELFYTLLRSANCMSVIETGVEKGASTSYMLQALSDNGGGSLHSIDAPNQFYISDSGSFHAEFNPVKQQPGWIIPTELRKNWKLTLGLSKDVLPGILEQLKTIDVFFHDSEHSYETMIFEYETAWPHIRPGGYLLSDDVLWNNAFSDFALQNGVQPFIIKGIGFIRKPVPLDV